MFALWLSDRHRSIIIRTLLWTALVLFLGSLYFPAVSNSPDPHLRLACASPDWAPGWMAFVGGPLGIVAGQFGWLANPLMLLALRRGNRKSGLGACLALLAVALALSTAVSLTSIPNDLEGNAVCGFGEGYYLWIACSVVVFIATFVKPADRRMS
jgi:hypothetical protein